jgi:hypothetical protein
MKISQTRITVERYRETIVQKEPVRCPRCGYEPAEQTVQTGPDPKTDIDKDIELSFSKEERF